MMFDVRTQPRSRHAVPADAPPAVTRRLPSRRSVLLGGAVSGVAGAVYGAGGPPQHLPRRPARAAMTFSRTCGLRIRYRPGHPVDGSPTLAATPGSGVRGPGQVTWRIRRHRQRIAIGGRVGHHDDRPRTRLHPSRSTRRGSPRHPLLVRVRFRLPPGRRTGHRSCDSLLAPRECGCRRSQLEPDAPARTATPQPSRPQRDRALRLLRVQDREYTGKGHADPLSTHRKLNPDVTTAGSGYASSTRPTPTWPRCIGRCRGSAKLGRSRRVCRQQLAWWCLRTIHRRKGAGPPARQLLNVRTTSGCRCDNGPMRAAHLYRRLRFGNLLDLSMLDLRTYRDREVSVLSRKIDDKARSITGKA